MDTSAFFRLKSSTAHLDGVLARPAREGDAVFIKRWISNGASGGDSKKINIILLCACATSRPACARVVEVVLPHICTSRHQAVLDDCLRLAAYYGAEETVKCLLRVGTDPQCTDADGSTPLLTASFGNNWNAYVEEWSRTNARRHATSVGNQNIIRMLLRHGAAVDARLKETKKTPLMLAARYSGFVSLGVVRELLRGGGSLDAVDHKGRTAEAIARKRLRKPIYDRRRIPEDPDLHRRPGAVEAFLELCAAVRAAGSWKRYANEPRLQLVVLRKLAESGRAVATRGVATRLFAPRRRVQAMGSRALPDVLFWKILEFWRTDRDP